MSELTQENLKSMSDKIDKIYSYIFGIVEDSGSGLTKKIYEMDTHLEATDKRVTALEDFVKKVNYYKAAFVSIGAAGAWIIDAIIRLIHK
jgi:hypothetical protein